MCISFPQTSIYPLVGTYQNRNRHSSFLVVVNPENNEIRPHVDLGKLDDFLYGRYDPISDFYAIANQESPAILKFVNMKNYSENSIRFENKHRIIGHQFFSARSLSVVLSVSNREKSPQSAELHTINLKTWAVSSVSQITAPAGFSFGPTPVVIDSSQFSVWLIMYQPDGARSIGVYDLLTGTLTLMTDVTEHPFTDMYFQDSNDAYLMSWRGGSISVDLSNGNNFHLLEPPICNDTYVSAVRAGTFDTLNMLSYNVVSCSAGSKLAHCLYIIDCEDGTFEKLQNKNFEHLIDIAAWHPLL